MTRLRRYTFAYRRSRHVAIFCSDTEMTEWRGRLIPVAHHVTARDRWTARMRGFSLLETLVALAIATLAVGVLLEAAGDMLRIDTIAARTTEAVVRARSHLALALADEAPVPGERDGEDGNGFRWHVRYDALTSDPATGNQSAATLYAVSVRITWPQGKGTAEVRLDSECLAGPLAP
jgi:general secretion pathway protein I